MQRNDEQVERNLTIASGNSTITYFSKHLVNSKNKTNATPLSSALIGALSEALSKKMKAHTDRECLVCQKLQTEPSGGTAKGSTLGGDQVHHVRVHQVQPQLQRRPMSPELNTSHCQVLHQPLCVTGQLRSLPPALT